MSTSVRLARQGFGVRLILLGAGLMLAGGASVTALLAITSLATGNLVVAHAHRPSAADSWRQAVRHFDASRPQSPRLQLAAADFADQDRLVQGFRSAEAPARGDEAMGAGLAALASAYDTMSSALRQASLQRPKEPISREASLVVPPRVISPNAPVQMASITPATQTIRVDAPEAVPLPAPNTDRAAASANPVSDEPVRAVPIPTSRPADFARMAQTPNGAASRARIVTASLETAAPEAAKAARPSALAYATPELEPKSEGPGDFFRKLLDQEGARTPRRGSGIAVYDIASATVRLPNGERLEAHSGLGHRQDNPRYVREKNRGPTPPNVYNLRMREARFHGAEAIRLLPSNTKLVFNRDGLLAHPYMYAGGGSRSQSNGCVVFKDYGRFLRAYKAGEIAKLVVVPNINELPTYVAGL